MDSGPEPAIGYDPDKAQARRAAPLSEEAEAGATDIPAATPPLEEESLNVSVVSNSLLLREGLAALLGTHIRLRIAASYAGSPVPATPVYCPPRHVVLLDATMGEAAAVAWTRYWLGMSPAPQVVVLQLLNNFDAVLACIEAGAGGYALQGASVEEVVGIIRQVQNNRAQDSPEVIAALYSRLASYSASARRAAEGSNRPRAPLTPRELEVLQLIAQDYSNQEIAGKLAIQRHTVKHHVRNMLEKLDLWHRWNTARLAEEPRNSEVGGAA